MAFIVVEGQLVHTSALSAPPPQRDATKERVEQCDACGSSNLIRVKACTRCQACGYKSDCNGW